MSDSKITIKNRFTLNQKQPITIPSSALFLQTNNLSPSVPKKKFSVDLLQNVIPHYKIAKKIVTPANLNIKSNNEKSEKLMEAKNFRIRYTRSNSDKFQSIEKQNIYLETKQKLQINANFSNNKYLLKNKLQKRPDTTGAKNRNKIENLMENKKENFIEFKDEFNDDLKELKFGEVLGEGSFAKVFKVLMPKTGNFIAVKVIDIMESSEELFTNQIKNLQNELHILEKIKHDNVVIYKGCKISLDKKNLYIFMEYMPGGSIASMLKQYGAFNENIIKKFVRQLLAGLDFLHSLGIVHSDLKGANILSDGNGNIKLADFGASKQFENLNVLSNSSAVFTKSTIGSLYWMAPEMLNHEAYGRKVDVWSLGCAILEMATSKNPWPDCENLPEFVVLVMTKKCPPIPEYLSEECQDFIRKCCSFDRKNRPSIKELMDHKFVL